MKLYDVTLECFDDQMGSGYGLAPTQCVRHEPPFNGFWNGQGIFHDVFEHWFEDRHKYFCGANRMNVGGEIVATGYMMYFDEHMNNRFTRTYFSTVSWVDTIGYLMVDAVRGHPYFGDTLECAVPYQPSYDFLDSIGKEVTNNLRKLYKQEGQYSDELERATRYLNSVTPHKINRLLKYGYHRALKLVQSGNGRGMNAQVLEDFIRFWDEFCSKTTAEQFHTMSKYIKFSIYKTDGKLYWRAKIDKMYGTSENYTIDSRRNMSADTVIEELGIYKSVEWE